MRQIPEQLLTARFPLEQLLLPEAPWAEDALGTLLEAVKDGSGCSSPEDAPPSQEEAVPSAAQERRRRERWETPGMARVTHPAYGTVVVPHRSNYAAILNAAEVWRCDWSEIMDAEIRAAEPGDCAEAMPDAGII